MAKPCSPGKHVWQPVSKHYERCSVCRIFFPCKQRGCGHADCHERRGEAWSFVPVDAASTDHDKTSAPLLVRVPTNNVTGRKRRCCSRCGQTGHWATTCREATPPPPPVKGTHKRACSICREPGHRATTCPRANSATPTSVTTVVEIERPKRSCSYCGVPGHRITTCAKWRKHCEDT